MDSSAVDAGAVSSECILYDTEALLHHYLGFQMHLIDTRQLHAAEVL